MIYLDNSATAPIDEEVRDAMLPYLNEEFGNPSSKYYCKATRAKNAVEEAREKVAKLLGANWMRLFLQQEQQKVQILLLKDIWIIESFTEMARIM